MVKEEEAKTVNEDQDYACALCQKLQGKGSNTPVETPNDTEEFIWNDKAIILLLEEYNKRKELLRNQKIKKKDLWLEITKVFQSHGYHIAGDNLDKKFRNLKQTFIRIKDHQNVKKNSGLESVRWKFYELMNEIFISNKEVFPEVPPIESNPQYRISQTVPVTNVDMNNLPSTSKAINMPLPSAPTSTTPPKNVGKKTVNRRQYYRDEHIKIEKEKIEVMKGLEESVDKNTDVLKELLSVMREVHTEKLKHIQNAK